MEPAPTTAAPVPSRAVNIFALAAQVLVAIDDLEEQAARMQERLYQAKDRKHQSARAMAARDLKADYAASGEPATAQ
jgi:hypothetical protein